MKIYQLHETGGSYDDFYDYIIASYVSKEKAEDHKQRLIQERQSKIDKYKKCNSCPIHEITQDKDYINKYCDDLDIILDEEGHICCKNEYCDCFCFEEYYEVKEVGVVE